MTESAKPVEPGSDGKPVQAIVLSGGGASGAYEVGVLKALLTRNERPLDPQVFAGTSIGSLNASFLVSRWDARGRSAVADLEVLWRENLANPRSFGRAGVFRFRANPLDLFDPSAYLPNPLRPLTRLASDAYFFFFEMLRRGSHFALGTGDLFQRGANLLDLAAFVAREPFWEIIQAIDFTSIRKSRRQLRIAATNYQTGKLKIFKNEHMTDETGPLAILASTAVPGVFPAVMIGADPHVDGAVVMNTPLQPAIEAKADELHVIYLDPDVEQIPVAALDSTLDTGYRQQLIGWAKVMNENIEAARRINRSLAALEKLRGDPAAAGIDLAWLSKQLHVENLRRITIHRYHPRDDLAGGALGLLRFETAHLARLIERGFEDTNSHDCDHSKCVLLESATG